MPAYVESLPSDRVTHMLGRPIQYLVTDSGDLGDVVVRRRATRVEAPFGAGFNPYATARLEAEPRASVVEDAMDDVGSSLFIEVADLQGLGCGGSIAADLSDCPCPQFGMSADDGAMGETQRTKRGAKAVRPRPADRRVLADKLRTFAALERVLVDAERKVLLEAADLVEKNRAKRRACGAKVAECRERVKALGKGAGLSGACPETLGLVRELQRLSRLDRALQGAERQVLCESARRISGIRSNLRKARAELAECRGRGGNVGAARLRAKLEACQKRYADHMREAHGK